MQTRAQMAFTLAQVLTETPGARERARALARLAAQLLSATADAVPEDVTAVRTWLRRHG